MKFYVSYLPRITIKRIVPLLLLVTALLFTLYFLLLTPPESPRRTKTNIIFNNKDLCVSKTSANIRRSAVIVVLSARNNFMKRNLVRQTWGSIKSANNINILAVVFMLGNLDAPGNEKADVSKLEDERDQFGDIVIGDFIDSYRNLTRKSIMAYEWLTSFCRNAHFVVKTDDDVFVNIFKLTEELNNFSQHEVISSNFWCSIHYIEPLVRDPTRRFYASTEDFPNGVFPKHCAGVGYVTPMGVVDRILDEVYRSFLERVCTHEDVFMTGILPQRINAQIKPNICSRLFKWWENNPINHINRMDEWVTYALETESGVDAECLLKLLQTNDKECLGKFREKFQNKIFYLFTHNNEYEERYRQLWILLNETFSK